jgi:hypothetical protein
MIIGARTIKSYGWENHFIAKACAARTKQTQKLIWFNILSQMGAAVFNNFGFLALIYIYLMQWNREVKLDSGFSLSLLAMVNFLFYSVNTMSFFGLMAVQNLMGVIMRISSVFILDEYDFDRRNTKVKREEVCFKLTDATISWDDLKND